MQLAAMLEPLGLRVIVQPAFEFRKSDIAAVQPALLAELEADTGSPLLIFTSPRAVTFGLPQLPAGLPGKCQIAAIGPATSQALEEAGIRVNVRPQSGFTSEDLLETLEQGPVISPQRSAYILAAPGGRRKMEESLVSRGWNVRVLMVYERENAWIDTQQFEQLKVARGILSVWTSANAMQSLSKRLPSASWLQLCLGEWLVISDRLRRMARAYAPAAIHLSAGPANSDIFSAIRGMD